MPGSERGAATKVADAYADMSPGVATFAALVDLDELRQVLVDHRVPGTGKWSYRAMALILCEAPKLLYALGITPAVKDLPCPQ